ncbi:MAG: FAD-binding oxidoreductase [Chthonomonadales bacterium]
MSEVATNYVEPQLDSNISSTTKSTSLPTDRLERVWGWGMADSAVEYVYQPSTAEGVAVVFETAKRTNRKIAIRGAGRSYGDASIGSEEISLDLTRFNRILDWDPSTGVIIVEPGVTISDIWRHCIGDGWWPYVVPGTMFPTIGGVASMNIHGKNNFAVGTIGDHILHFEILLPNGETRSCSREVNAELFHAAIGGFGMLGCFLTITLELKRIYSGKLKVLPISCPDLRSMMDAFETRSGTADYLVAWLDCFGKGTGLGRGLMHQANYLQQGEDSAPFNSLKMENQELPDTFLFGLVPKSMMWRFMKPFVRNTGMHFINWAKYQSGKLSHLKSHMESHAGFAFLLDYVPNWKWSYRPGGLIQYQSFIPKETAYDVFRKQVELQHKFGIISYLGVMKRHREDPFLMTHAVDGFSLALDFKVTKKNKARLWKLCAEMDELVLHNGGRFYFAKDSTIRAERMSDYLQEERVQAFLKLKKQVDPENMLQTNLYRRVFGQDST